MRSSTTPLRRFTVASITALALGAALVGCGDSDDKSDAESSPSAPPVKVLSETEVTAALITAANLGGDLPIVPDDGEDSDSPGCMNDVTAILDENSTAKAEEKRDFGAAEGGKSLQVQNKVFSYESVEAAETVVKDLRAALAECTEVKETDDDGLTYDLEVETNDDKDESDADDQVNADATGTISTSGGASGQVSFLLAIVRVDNNITAVSGATVDTDLPGPLSDVVEVAYDRLVAVAEGKTPDEDVVAGR